MYNFTSGSKCHLHLYSTQLQKLIYINVRLLPVERNVIIGQVWTCVCLESLMQAQQRANPAFSRTPFGGCVRAGWCLSVPLVAVGQEWDPAALQTQLRAPHLPQFPCSNPFRTAEPQEFACCGTSDHCLGVQGQNLPVDCCLVFKEGH